MSHIRPPTPRGDFLFHKISKKHYFLTIEPDLRNSGYSKVSIVGNPDHDERYCNVCGWYPSELVEPETIQDLWSHGRLLTLSTGDLYHYSHHLPRYFCSFSLPFASPQEWKQKTSLREDFLGALLAQKNR